MSAKNKWDPIIERWLAHPAMMVRELFKVEPQPFQEEALECFPHKKRIAMKASKGVGKSAVLAWLIWNFLLRENAQIMVTSISGDNLKDGVWKELATWYGKSPLLQQAFVMGTTRISSKKNPDNWFASARTWPKAGSDQQQADSLAGFHSPFCMGVIDEAGGVPEAVMAAAEAILSTGVETKLIISGNPTHRSGPLFRACVTDRKQWHVIEISSDPDNPKRATIVDSTWAREYIEKYGRDDPRVLVNIFGQFPPHSFDALIGDDEVREAMDRQYARGSMGQYAKLIGIDVARQGDDFSVLARRHGLQAYPFIRRSHIENGQIGASLANRVSREFGADAILVDATGGFGHTWIDAMHVLGLSPIGVQFARQKGIDQHYYNLRAMMYFEMVQWIRNGGALSPRDDDGSDEGAKRLIKSLSNTSYTFRGDRLLLEDKDEIKSKIGFSPDEADALACTFAEPISPTKRQWNNREAFSAVSQYNPFADIDRIVLSQQGAVSSYDPFKS